MKSPLFAAALLTCSAAMAQDEIVMHPGIAKQYEAPAPFSTIWIANPKVVDGLAASNRLVTLTPQGEGSTNVLFLNEEGREVAELIVHVALPGKIIKIHNHQKLHGSTKYRCTPDLGCEFESETHYQLPTQRIIQENINR